MLNGRKIVVGVTGGIAAYKAAELVSRLRQDGAAVPVVLTDAAQEFIRPLVFEALTGQDVFTGLFGGRKPLPHITLASESDLLVIYPATANVIGQAACGLAPDLLTTLLLAFKGPVIFCPAMNSKMYENPALQENIRRLEDRGYIIISPETGRLACGETGAGRLAPVTTVLETIRGVLAPKDFKGFNFLVTAGPTREHLDPVRYITNRSSGKMGYAIARAARDRGARVVLVSGPTSLEKPAGISCIDINTALEMREAVLSHFDASDVVIMCAAVSDYRPADLSTHKIKKGNAELTVKFTLNPDILVELGSHKRQQILVGFAAETEKVLDHARTKLQAKNLDLIVANDIGRKGAGFESDTNVVGLVFRDGRFIELPMMDKFLVAHRLLDVILDLRQNDK
ncbi:MAG: bifunctional phosphopantothenoylcysteine decarboxylase/phosphopantothenate--cysteine ligase CoaBC [Bacillota bacterium]